MPKTGSAYSSGSPRQGATGALASQQEIDPWGRVRAGGMGQTTLNATGQRLDRTGLLSYHARSDDPVLGRFLSADRVVPGALTAAPHDATARTAWCRGAAGRPTRRS